MSEKLRKSLLIAIGIIAAGCLLYLLYRDYRPEIEVLMHPQGNVKEKLLYLIRQHDVRDSLFLLGLIAVLNAIPGMSNSVFCILAGLCYGPWLGLLINWCGNVLGNSIVAIIIKKIQFSHKFKKNKFLNFLMNQKHPELGMMIGFMIPFIPSILVDYTAVQFKMSAKKYLIIVMCGMFPTSFIYAFGGDAIFAGNMKRVIALLITIITLLLIAFILVKIITHHSNKAAK